LRESEASVNNTPKDTHCLLDSSRTRYNRRSESFVFGVSGLIDAEYLVEERGDQALLIPVLRGRIKCSY